MNRICFLPAVLIFGMFACDTGTNKSHNDNDKFAVDVNDDGAATTGENTVRDEDFIFYNFFSPVDLNQIIDENNGYYNSAYLNSLNNIPKYSVSHKIALNIGVYGADLSYLWIFEQTQQALTYLKAIQHLSTQLGIPEAFVGFTAESVQKSDQNADTLVGIARDAYYATDRYLKGSDMKNAATLILVGGWVESLHIALEMYTQPNAKLASKIISQKYALNSLITLMQGHQDDIVMTEYLLLMRRLNDSFRVFEAKLKPEDIEINTVTKRIIIKETPVLEIDPKLFEELRANTASIREHIIE